MAESRRGVRIDKNKSNLESAEPVLTKRNVTLPHQKDLKEHQINLKTHFNKLEKLRRRNAFLKKIQTKQEIQAAVASFRNRAKENFEELKKMRQNLPNYNLSDIRELRLPGHQSFILNLEEDGFLSTSEFIKELISYQDDLRRNAEIGSSILVSPELKNSKHTLDILSRSLKIAENFHNKQQYSDECEQILNVAINFAFGKRDWWWLGEQILLQSISNASEYSDQISDKYEALSRYAYARFLLKNLKEFDAAFEQLRLTKNMSANRAWTCKQYFKNETGTLFMQTNEMMFHCMLVKVNDMMTVDLKKSIDLAEQAREMAAHACSKRGEADAYVIKGICEMLLNRTKSAIQSFNRALSIQARLGNIEEKCKIRIHLAKAYLFDECPATSLNILMELKQDAEQFNLPFYLGQAYKNLGSYYLLVGNTRKAIEYLRQSNMILNDCDVTMSEIEKIRNLTALSEGQQLLSKYVELVLEAGNKNAYGKSCLKWLLDWKIDRTPFS